MHLINFVESWFMQKCAPSSSCEYCVLAKSANNNVLPNLSICDLNNWSIPALLLCDSGTAEEGGPGGLGPPNNFPVID